MNQNEKRKLHLRKERISTLISVKRQLKTKPEEESNYQFALNINDFSIPKEVSDTTIQTMEEGNDFLISLLISKNIDKVKYSLYAIKHELSEKNLTSFILLYNRGFINLLLEIINNYIKDTKIIYESLFIITNFTYIISDSALAFLLISPESYRLWEIIFDYNIPQINCLIIWIFSNFPHETQSIITNLTGSNLVIYKILPFLENIDKYKNDITIKEYNEIIDRGINLISILVKYPNNNYNNNDFRKRGINIIIKYADTDKVELFLIIIDILAKISEEKGKFNIEIERSGVIEMILNNKMQDNKSVHRLSVRLLGNFTVDTEEEKAVLLMGKIIHFAKRGLDDDYNEVRGYCAWLLSNLVLTSAKAVSEVISDIGVLDKIMWLFKKEKDEAVLKEVIFLLANLILSADINDFYKIISFGFIEEMIKIIEKFNRNDYLIWLILTILLTALKNSDKVKDEFKDNLIVNIINKNGGREIIEKLQNCEQALIAKIADDIIYKFLNVSKENCEWNIL